MSNKNTKIPDASQIQIGTKFSESSQTSNINNFNDDINSNSITYEDIHIIEDQINKHLNTFEDPDNTDIVIPDMNLHYNNIEQKNDEFNKFQNSDTTKNIKYHIMSLFWIINPKIQSNKPLDENEVDAVTISYNMDFGNLRIEFYKIPNGAIRDNVMFLNKLDQKATGTIYPASCFRALHNEIDVDDFICIEQLVMDTGEHWQHNRPMVRIYRERDIIRIDIWDPAKKEQFMYDFIGYQKKLIEHAFAFVLENGFKLHGQNILTNK